jgi:hypothetical protein
MKWASHVARMEGIRPPVRSRSRWDNNITTHFCKGVNRIHAATDTDRRRVVVNMGTNLRAPPQAGNFLYTSGHYQLVNNSPLLIRAITVAARSWSLGNCDRGFESRSRHGCLSLSFCAVLSCVGTGLASGWPPSSEWVLPIVELIHNFKSNSELEQVQVLIRKTWWRRRQSSSRIGVEPCGKRTWRV